VISIKMREHERRHIGERHSQRFQEPGGPSRRETGVDQETRASRATGFDMLGRAIMHNHRRAVAR
jgi:hypothetical protein